MKLVLDRIEENSKGIKVAVFEMENGSFVEILGNNMPNGFIEEIQAGDIVEAEIKDGKIISATILKNETEQKRVEMKSRLGGLFNRKKNKKS